MKKAILHSLPLLLALILLLSALTGCADKTDKPDETTPPVVEEPVTITVVGAWEDCKAVEAVGREFTKMYQNCTIRYEYLQNYDEALLKRLDNNNNVDLFFSNSIQADSSYLPYAADLFACDGLDLSKTYDGLIDNYVFFDDDKTAERRLYAIPLGAEMRGMYINKTLLDSLNIAIPTNQATLLDACEKLKSAGYIPFHGNPGAFSQTLLYPWVCNTITGAADYQAAYDKVNSRSDGLGQMFSEQFEFLYTLVEEGYYDYKKAQSDLNLFKDASDEGYCKDFLNIRQNGDNLEKADDIGQVAFMPSPLSLMSTLDQMKEDYHSEIEYIFMPAPVGDDGGYVYMSPARGMVINKNSANFDWSVKFLNFLFKPENNKLFAEEFDVIPNTEDAFSYVSTQYDVPESHISQVGQVSFDYAFYKIIVSTLTDISKGNNPKYMQGYVDGGANDNLTLFPLEKYVSEFEKEIKGDAE